MSKNLEKCLNAFDRGEAHGKPFVPDYTREAYAGLHGNRAPCWTDGKKIYSYRMPIVWRDENGDIVIADRKDAKRPDGGGRGGISMTTRNHIDMCRRHAFVPSDRLILVAADVVRAADGRAA